MAFRFSIPAFAAFHKLHACTAVSYTHLDVYKRQPHDGLTRGVPAQTSYTDQGGPALKRTDYISWDEYFMGVALLLSLIHIFLRNERLLGQPFAERLVPALPRFFLSLLRLSLIHI